MKSAIRRGIAGGLVLLLVVIANATEPTASSATDQIFMQVPGIPGSSVAAGRSGWIDVLSFSGSGVAPTTSGGKPPCQIVVQKSLDIASPHLWVATVTGQVFSASPIKIQLTKPGTTGGPYYVLYDIELTNAEITSIGDSGSSALPTESLTLKADKVTVTFNAQNPATGAITPITASFGC